MGETCQLQLQNVLEMLIESSKYKIHVLCKKTNKY